MDKNIADVTLHIDEALNDRRREGVSHTLRELPGVIEVKTRSKTPHLMIVEYNPASLKSDDILHAVTCRGLRAELIGL